MASVFNEDIQKYPLFFFDMFDRTLKPIPKGELSSVDDYDHSCYHAHHFIEKQVRKNNLSFYQRIEYLQKIIIVPAQMNYDASNGTSEEKFFKNWGIEKYKIIFSKQAWEQGLYCEPSSFELS